MNLINYLPKIKLIVGIILIILLIALYGYLFPKEFIFSCSGYVEETKWTNEKKSTLINRESRDEFERIVKVNKYFQGYFFTINNYSIFQCSKITQDIVFCSYRTNYDDIDDFDMVKLKYSSSRVNESGEILKKEYFHTKECELKENIFK